MVVLQDRELKTFPTSPQLLLYQQTLRDVAFIILGSLKVFSCFSRRDVLHLLQNLRTRKTRKKCRLLRSLKRRFRAI